MGDMVILVIACHIMNERTGEHELIASHGVDLDTGRNVTLPGEHPHALGARFDPRYNEYVIPDQRNPA
jgi:hypothetical protein